MPKSLQHEQRMRFLSSTQTGAAMVESILILSLMVAVLTAIPSIAKRQDIRQASVDANRYTTWEMTVSTTADRELVVDRFFVEADAAIRSTQTELNDNRFWKNQQVPLVREHAFNAASANLAPTTDLIDLRSVRLDVFEQAADSGAVANAITGTVRTVSDLTGSENAIAGDRGIVQTAISVGVGDRSVGEDGQPLECSRTGDAASNCLSISSAILVDGWEAHTEDDIEEGAQAMVPTKLIAPLGEVFDAVSLVPFLEEFEDMDDNFGCVNTSVLPTKELTGELSTSVGTANEC